MSTMRELSLEEVANQYGGTHRAAKEYNALRACVAELEREVEAKRQDHEAACCIIADMHRAAVGEVTGPRRGVVEDVEDIHRMAECAAIMAVSGYFSRMRGPDLQVAYKQFGGGCTRRFLKSEDAVRVHRDEGYEMTPLYAGSAPVPAVPQAVDVDAICNAYESGVGHRGRPTANVNPYREGTPEHEAYAIGAKGEAAQAEEKVADDVVRHIAEIVHNGGLRGIDPYNAIRLIRLLTLDVWDKSGTIDDMKDRVDAAMLAAKAKGGWK